MMCAKTNIVFIIYITLQIFLLYDCNHKDVTVRLELFITQRNLIVFPFNEIILFTKVISIFIEV
jgi:hypothetical protein